VKQYQKLLEMDNVNLEFETDALKAIASEAIKRNTGARGLRAIIESIMLDVMFDVPSRTDVNHCLITQEVVQNKIMPMLTLAKADKKSKKEESA
jgi:ATP-dependent Clp protease ATP-binding subunit ClpX